MKTTFVLLTALALPATLFAQMEDCPMHAQHMAARGTAVDHRHDTLGVAHETTHHSFRLFDNGAAIELRANDAADSATVGAIRKHIRMIADQFRANDFSTPMFVHDKTPDGVPAIKQLHAQIDFRYEELADGARIRMTTANAAALTALHDFMHFQIVEHRTADQGSIEHEAK